MPGTPKALICVLEEEEKWNHLLQFFREHDVSEGDDPHHAYDARDNVVYYWGRDGWRKGYWHAKIYRVKADIGWNLIAEQNEDDRAADVLRIAKIISGHIHNVLEKKDSDE